MVRVSPPERLPGEGAGAGVPEAAGPRPGRPGPRARTLASALLLARCPARLGRQGRRHAGSDGRAAGTPARGGRLAAADRGFAGLTAAPAIALVAWLVPGLGLLLAGEFSPVPQLLVAVPLATALAVNTLHRVPARWPPAVAGGRPEGTTGGAVAWLGLLGTPAVAVGFAAWQLALRSPSVLAARTPGAAFQAGYWIAEHGSLPVPGSLAAFGGAAGLHLSSIGFFQQGGAVVPGVQPGLPMLLAAGFWTSGLRGGGAVGPVLGALAVLSFGGLAGRLAGRQWAPLAALALALTLPEIYTARDAFSEPAVQLLLFGGMSLVADSLAVAPGGAIRPGDDHRPGPAGRAGRRREIAGPRAGGAARARMARRAPAGRLLAPARLLGALGGLALGLASLLSLGSLAYLIPAIAVAGVLLAARPATGVPFTIGLAAGGGSGLLAGYVLARPLADAQAPVLEAIGRDAAGALLVTAVVLVALARPGRARRALRRAVAARPLRWLPPAAGGAVAIALALLAARPYLQVTRGDLGRGAADYVAALQRAEGLPVDPARLYAEDTLYWVIWYAGMPAVLLGGFGAAVLLRRCLRALLAWRDDSGAALAWALPLAVTLAGAAAVLWQPLTVPDQPWASRRLVPVVLPGLILLAAWASGWLARRARDRGAGVATGGAIAAFCLVAVALPAASTSFGFGLSHSGVSGGLRPGAGGLAQHRVRPGEDAAVAGLCAALGRSSSVVIVDRRVAQLFTQVIRGVCGLPAAWLPQGARPPAVDAVLSGIFRAGRRPVVLGARPGEVAGYGGPPQRVLDLRTTQDPHELTRPPGAPWPARYVIWMAAASAPGTGL